MTQDDAIIILTIMKAAYPKDYPYNMSVDDARITATVWAEQFKDIPGQIVQIAVKQLIAKEEKCFSIARVKKQLGSLYWDAKGLLDKAEQNKLRDVGNPTAEQTKEFYKFIINATSDYKYSKAIELPISQIVGKEEMLLLGGGTDAK